MLRTCRDAGSEIECEDLGCVILAVPFNDAADDLIALHEKGSSQSNTVETGNWLELVPVSFKFPLRFNQRIIRESWKIICLISGSRDDKLITERLNNLVDTPTSRRYSGDSASARRST